VLRSYLLRCLALSLPSSIAAWITWYFAFAVIESALVLLSRLDGRFPPPQGLLEQSVAVAVLALLPVAALLAFRGVLISPYRLFRDSAQTAARNKFPPSSIVRTREDSYCILLAVAGFSRDEITVTEHEQMLIVAGQKAESDPQSGGEFPRGTFGYPFERRFNLAANVEVRGASLENGLLRIDVHEQLEPKRPRRIDIRPIRLTPAPAKVVDRPKVA